MVKMEASKCPKCGDEPHFVEHIAKWYCYGCNTYIEDETPASAENSKIAPEGEPHPAPEDHAEAIAAELDALEHEDQKPMCSKCGAELEEVKEGKLFCYICETYADEPVPEAKPVVAPSNEAQSLLDSAAMASPKEEQVVHIPGASVVPPLEVLEERKAPAPEVKMCSICGQPLKWIDKYQRHYCYGCRKYAPKEGVPKKEESTSAPTGEGARRCPDCGGELKFVEKYGEHYCFACKKYPFHKKAEPASQGAPTPARPQVLMCPKCGDPLKYIEKYQRHYCFTCKEYAPKGFGGAPQEAKICPICNGSMKFITEYNEWYCYTCKKYSLRPAKPVLLF